MVSDINKQIVKIEYNELNLPVSIEFPFSNKITKSYDLLGNKKKETVYNHGQVNSTEFADNIVYEGGKPSYILFDEGRVILQDNGVYVFENYLKDMLGSNIVTYTIADPTIYIRQVNNYYPTGLNIKELTANWSRDSKEPKNDYLYNGKSFQDDLELNWYDYGARMYDPQIGRFHTQDRFAEKYYLMTPYQYAANNPLLFIDVNGDSLYVAKNAQSHDDIRNLAKKRNQQYICFNADGSVSLDFTGVDAKTKKKALRDEGIQTINNLVESKDVEGNTENYYYEASNNREGVYDGASFSINLDKNAGKETGLNDNSFATNLSTTPPEKGGKNILPPRGYDGTVYISPGTMYNIGVDGSEHAVSRSSLVRHELNENYNRTHKKMYYKEAHRSAGGIGEYTRFIYAPLK